MRRLIALALVVALTSGGCASFQYAVAQFPQRTSDAFSDPVRRQHLVSHASLEMSTAGVGITCATMLIPTLIGSLLVCPLVAMLYNYLTYEFVLEPISRDRVKDGLPSLVGPYWERDPEMGKCSFTHDTV